MIGIVVKNMKHGRYAAVAFPCNYANSSGESCRTPVRTYGKGEG
jgi:hypothetical protein